MSVSFFSGTWVFDPNLSQMPSPFPLSWIQYVHLEDDRVRIREEITRSTGVSAVEVDAVIDGSFYPVSGSPTADEIAYVWEGESIRGVGRKDGAVLLRELVSIPQPDQMTMSISLVVHGREIPLGTALFHRALDPAAFSGQA